MHNKIGEKFYSGHTILSISLHAYITIQGYHTVGRIHAYPCRHLIVLSSSLNGYPKAGPTHTHTHEREGEMLLSGFDGTLVSIE